MSSVNGFRLDWSIVVDVLVVVVVVRVVDAGDVVAVVESVNSEIGAGTTNVKLYFTIIERDPFNNDQFLIQHFRDLPNLLYGLINSIPRSISKIKKIPVIYGSFIESKRKFYCSGPWCC